MATSTFYKNIVIDDAAADRLIEILNKPAPPRPDISGNYKILDGDELKCFLQRLSEKSSRKDSSNQ
ncbi:MAG: hypothetical protein FWG90_03565 [Oscillospiraceae bacterium]|nr:hypothetical protein [Oscillospiraceae bacterium]